MTVVHVCTTCRQPHLRESKPEEVCGETLLGHVRKAADDTPLEIRGVACLMGCEHGCNIAISSDNKMTYVLGDFRPEEADAAAIVDYATRHADAPGGIVPYREWPQGVKGHFKARVPPLAAPPEL